VPPSLCVCFRDERTWGRGGQEDAGAPLTADRYLGCPGGGLDRLWLLVRPHIQSVSAEAQRRAPRRPTTRKRSVTYRGLVVSIVCRPPNSNPRKRTIALGPYRPIVRQCGPPLFRLVSHPVCVRP
jgi:hypothetical protein